MVCCLLLVVIFTPQSIILAAAVVPDVAGQCISNKTCNGHGFCRTGCFSSTCTCFGEYTGTFCQIPPICTSGGNECGEFGECNNCSLGVGGKSFCVCNSGYSGRFCNIAPDCTEGGNECQNGGYCNFEVIPYTCVCPPLYTGNSTTCGAHHLTYVTTTLILTGFLAFIGQK